MTAITPAVGDARTESISESVTRVDRIQAAFDCYRSEIDAHNDRRERLIKASRDITNLSKKLIFHLHRIPLPTHLSTATSVGNVAAPSIADGSDLATHLAQTKPRSKMWAEAAQKQEEIVRLIQRVAFEEGLSQGKQDSMRYERNLGGGIEEFIEAVSFQNFLERGELITREQVQDLFVSKKPIVVQSSAGQPIEVPVGFVFPIPTHRYLLGISDLTGELMRFATTALGGGGGDQGGSAPSDPGAMVRAVLSLLREIRESLEPFVFLVNEMKKKQAITTSNLRKVEDLWYQISIRMSEFGGDNKAIREIVRRALEGGAGGNGSRDPGDDDDD